jgi:AcrR family transcriptional regulator
MSAARRRADAERNRLRLLAAAREVFDEHGTDAPLDVIARRAGVGNATMYRHFANRRELALAVYADEVTAVCERGAALLDDPAPGDALFAWLLAFTEHVATKGGLAMIGAGEPAARGSELFAQWHDAMRSTATALVDRARHAGAVRPDLDPGDLLQLASGIARTGADPARTRHLLDLLRHGTTPR